MIYHHLALHKCLGMTTFSSLLYISIYPASAVLAYAAQSADVFCPLELTEKSISKWL